MGDHPLTAFDEVHRIECLLFEARCCEARRELDRLCGRNRYDRPRRCTSSYRLSYAPYQGVFNVGFRVAMEE